MRSAVRRSAPIRANHTNACAGCAARAVNADGERLTFSNEGLSGGFVATIAVTGEQYPSHDCYIDGVPCRADEARFGGIVIEPC